MLHFVNMPIRSTATLVILLLSACETLQPVVTQALPNEESIKSTVHPGPPPEVFRVSAEKIAEAGHFVKEGLPFEVKVEPYGAVRDGPPLAKDGELANLKRGFLTPLAKSSHVKKIARVAIDASALEWTQWTCIIEIEGGMQPISLTHFAGFYDGKGNQDREGYKSALKYVLGELDKMAVLAGWDQE
ncbi:MAG: hypothetical protein JWO89_2258 [Verrucomicrobiaceae bacterium]|nr:hypothetical protein [Verrucomicrobiaceae bacterium]